jgi:soluble lytic murein transglycosylase
MLFLLGCWFILGMAAPASADIYKYVDENGIIHFTNAPTSSKYRVYVRDNFFLPGGSFRATDKYDAYIQAAARKYGISFSLIKAIIQAESSFNPRAVSHAGALGLMQLMPANVRLLNIQDPFDPFQNIMGGTRFFKSLLNRYNGKLSLALAGYNAGPHRVDQYNGIPPFEETQNYVRKVLHYYRMMK